MPLKELVPILQIAIGPVILISGVGLLLLSMTNRFGSLIVRSRQLAAALRSANDAERELVLAQIRILSIRASLERRAITLAAMSVLFAAALVMTLFIAAVTHWEAGTVLVTLFACCLLFLIAAVIEFLRDINLSLSALKLELSTKHERDP